jgi:hypothetical protein
MPYATVNPPAGNPQPAAVSGAIGSNAMLAGLAIPAGTSKVFNYVANTSANALLYLSFGTPVSSTQFNVVLPASGTPFTDPGMIQSAIYVSGGSFVAWSM